MIEAAHLAFADRAKYVGDQSGVPLEHPALRHVRRGAGLPDQPAATRSRRRSRPATSRRPTAAAPPRPAGARSPPDTENVNTTNLTVADKDGNVVEYTLTIEQTGGSGIVLPGRGFLLNNELTDFSAVYDPADPNRIEPGKRPRSSMSPTIVLQDRQAAARGRVARRLHDHHHGARDPGQPARPRDDAGAGDRGTARGAVQHGDRSGRAGLPRPLRRRADRARPHARAGRRARHVRRRDRRRHRDRVRPAAGCSPRRPSRPVAAGERRRWSTAKMRPRPGRPPLPLRGDRDRAAADLDRRSTPSTSSSALLGEPARAGRQQGPRRAARRRPRLARRLAVLRDRDLRRRRQLRRLAEGRPGRPAGARHRRHARSRSPSGPATSGPTATSNILENPHVGLNFLIPGRGDTLRINGRARLVSDAPFFDEMVVKGHRPLLAWWSRSTTIFFHCAKAFLRSGHLEAGDLGPRGPGAAPRGDRQGGRADRDDRRGARRLLQPGELRQGSLRPDARTRSSRATAPRTTSCCCPTSTAPSTASSTAEQVRALCDRRAGIGGDGVLRVVRCATETAPDGASGSWTTATPTARCREMCGNGIRVLRPLPGRRRAAPTRATRSRSPPATASRRSPSTAT